MRCQDTILPCSVRSPRDSQSWLRTEALELSRESKEMASVDNSAGVRFRIWGSLWNNSVYPACTWVRRLCSFSPFCRFVESISYVVSIPLRGSTPTPGTSPLFLRTTDPPRRRSRPPHAHPVDTGWLKTCPQDP